MTVGRMAMGSGFVSRSPGLLLRMQRCGKDWFSRALYYFDWPGKSQGRLFAIVENAILALSLAADIIG